MRKQNTKFSIIIPHLNEGYYLDIMLDSFYNYIKYDNYEIIIVDDGSDDLSHLDFLDNHFLINKIKLYKKKGLGSHGARNFGASNASGDVLVFLDSHMYLKEDILEKINLRLNEKKDISLLQPVIGSIGDKKVKGNIYKIKDNLLNSTWDNAGEIFLQETPNIAGGATVVKKDVFDELGGFNINFKKWGAEDLEFSMRAWLMGYSCYLDKSVLINHYFKEKFSNTTVSSQDVLFNKIIFALTCFKNQARQENVLLELKKHHGDKLYYKQFNSIIDDEKIVSWIKNQKSKFKYDDDWYFDKFKKYYKEFV